MTGLSRSPGLRRATPKSSSTLPSFPGSASRSNAAAASAAGKTRSTSGAIRPDARCGTTSRANARIATAFSSRGRARSIVPDARVPAGPSACGGRAAPRCRRRCRRSRSALRSRAPRGRRRGSGRRRARARRPRRPRPARARRARPDRSPSPRARRPAPAARRLRTVASTRAPAAAAICTAAVPTPPLAPLTTRSSPGRSPAWLMIASCAVTNTSGTAAAASSSRLLRHGGHVQLVHQHPVGEAAAADEAEDAVARREPPGGRPAGDHGARHLEAGHVGRRPGRGGVAALSLRQVGRVQRRVADGDEDVVARRARDRASPRAGSTSLPPAPVKTIARMLGRSVCDAVWGRPLACGPGAQRAPHQAAAEARFRRARQPRPAPRREPSPRRASR